MCRPTASKPSHFILTADTAGSFGVKLPSLSWAVVSSSYNKTPVPQETRGISTSLPKYPIRRSSLSHDGSEQEQEQEKLVQKIRNRDVSGPKCPVRQSSFRHHQGECCAQKNTTAASTNQQDHAYRPVSLIAFGDNDDDISWDGSEISSLSIQEDADDDGELLRSVRISPRSNEEASPAFPSRRNSIANMVTNCWEETPIMIDKSSNSAGLPSLPKRKESSECLVGLLMQETSLKTLHSSTTTATTGSMTTATPPKLPMRRGSFLM